MHAEGFAQAEKVVGLVVDAEEGAGKSADAAVEADGVLALFLDLQKQVDGAGFGVLMSFGVLIDLERLEVFELVQAQQAVFPELGVVDLALVEEQLAADDAIAGDGVALELDTGDIELLAFVDVDLQRDGLLLLVVDGLGDGAEVDVAQRAVRLLQVFETLADEGGVEPVAVLDSEGGAKGLDIGDVLIPGKGDGAEPVAAPSSMGMRISMRLPRLGRKVNKFRPPSSRIWVGAFLRRHWRSPYRDRRSGRVRYLRPAWRRRRSARKDSRR